MLKTFIKKWVFLFVLIVFSLVISIKTAISFFYYCFWLLICLVLLSSLWILLTYFGANLRIKRSLPGKTEEDDSVDINTQVHNTGWMPVFNCALADNLGCAPLGQRMKSFLIDCLWPLSGITMNYRTFCYQRGRYELGPFTVYLFDPLGLFFFKKTYNVYSALYVYPKTFQIKKFPPLTKGTTPWFGIETSRLSGDDDELFGIREYKEGDPIQRVHWLSTAKKNKLIVKQYQSQSFYRATILFSLSRESNFGSGKECVAEYIVKIASSVAKYLLEKGVSLELIAHTGEIVNIPFNKGPEHLEEILRFLTVAKAESRVSLGEVFEEFSRYIPNYSSLVVIMLDKEWEYLQGIMSLEQRHVSIVPLILVSSTFMYSMEKGDADVARDVGIKLSQALDFYPILISKGQNLEEAFLKL